jgi:hypothetical protein
MGADDPPAQLREELGQVDEELARLRTIAAELRRQIGERSYEPTDPAERSLLITEAEQQEALVAVLERRREELLQRLREPG